MPPEFRYDNLPLPIEGVVLARDSKEPDAAKEDEKKLLDGLAFLDNLKKKMSTPDEMKKLNALPSGKTISNFINGNNFIEAEMNDPKNAGKDFVSVVDEGLSVKDIDALFESLKGDRGTTELLKKAYDEAYDDKGKVKEGKEQEAKDFQTAMKAQMLAAQLTAAGNDPAKIKIIVDELKSLSVTSGSAAQPIVAAAQSQAGNILSAAIAAVSSVAGGVVAAVSWVSDKVGSMFRTNQEEQRFQDLLKQQYDKLDKMAFSNNEADAGDKEAKAQILKDNFKMLQGKGKIDLLEPDNFNASTAEAEKLKRAVTNVMTFRTIAEGASDEVVKRNNQVIKQVNEQIEALLKMQLELKEKEQSGGDISADRKALNKAKTDLKGFIQANVLGTSPVMGAGQSVTTAGSGLVTSTETTMPTDPSRSSSPSK